MAGAVPIHPDAPHVPAASFRIERKHAGKPVVIRGDAYLADRARTGVILCHGFKGFGRWGFYPYLAPSMAAAGLNAITFDFSGSGVGDDRETYTERDAFRHNTYTQELADVAAVVAEARGRGWIADSYGVFGHSRGGGDAILHTASSPGVGALVTWAAIAHVLRWLPHEVAVWRERGYTEIVNARTGDVLPLGVSLLDECERLSASVLDIERAAGEIRIPWLLVHGSEDESVSVADAHRLFAAAGGAAAENVKLEIIDGAGHTFGARHPLGSIEPTLRTLVAQTVAFFAASLE